MEKLHDEPLQGDALRNKILSEFQVIAEENEIDLEYIPPRKFSYILSELNRRVIKPNKNIIYKDVPNKCDRYNQDKVNVIYNIFKSLCMLYNQENSLSLFITFSGIHKDTIYEWSSSGASDLHKRLMADDEASLEQMLQDRSLNPMKILPSLNKKHGWNQSGTVGGQMGITVNVGTLPQLSDSSSGSVPQLGDNTQ